MAAHSTCRICTPLLKILNLKEGKTKFCSKKNDETFKKTVVEIEGKKMSFNELKKQFVDENPTINKSLMSVPTTLLLEYKKLDHSVTEEDVRDYLKGEFKEAFNRNKEKLRSPKIANMVKSIYNRLKDRKLILSQAIEELNGAILDLIFVGDNTPTDCKLCKNKKKTR